MRVVLKRLEEVAAIVEFDEKNIVGCGGVRWGYMDREEGRRGGRAGGGWGIEGCGRGVRWRDVYFTDNASSGGMVHIYSYS